MNGHWEEIEKRIWCNQSLPIFFFFTNIMLGLTHDMKVLAGKIWSAPYWAEQNTGTNSQISSATRFVGTVPLYLNTCYL